jgi:CO/xanthine dehydrogenase FAD-binding subunit
LLDASVVNKGSGDRRSVPATEFFRGVFTTASDHDEVVVEVVFPRPAPRAALTEFAERRGDIATVATALDLDASRELGSWPDMSPLGRTGFPAGRSPDAPRDAVRGAPRPMW